MEDERFVLQVFHLHRVSRRKCVRWSYDQRQFVSMNRNDLKPRVPDRECNDSEIQRTFDDSLRYLPSDRAMYVDLNLRVSPLERCQHFGQHVKTRGLVC